MNILLIKSMTQVKIKIIYKRKFTVIDSSVCWNVFSWKESQSRLWTRSGFCAEAGGEEIYFLSAPLSPEFLWSGLDYSSCEECSENI